MADIVINEISQNYSYVIGDSSYCCVALPITSCWGPAYTAPAGNEDAIEDVVWQRFRANSQGLESFVSTYRGAAANYRLSQDYSYQMAVSLLTAGYDVLVCRLSPGSKASGFLRRAYEGTLADNWSDGLSLSAHSARFPEPQQAKVFRFSGIVVATSITSCTYGTDDGTKTDLVAGTDYSFDADAQTLTILSTSTVVPASAEADHYVYVTYDCYASAYKDVVEQGNLTLPVSDISLYCDANHPVTVSSSHPNFSTATITSAVASVPSDAATGVYIVKSGSTLSAVFHLAGTLATRQDATSWAQYGIVGGETFVVTGDKDLETSSGTLSLTAKYPGTFGNRLQCSLRRMTTAGVKYWNLITYIVDASGVRTAVENLNFVFDIENSTDNIPFVEEVQSQFIDIIADHLTEDSIFATSVDEKLTIVFRSGSDKEELDSVEEYLKKALDLAAFRYNTIPVADSDNSEIEIFTGIKPNAVIKLTGLAPVDSVSCQYRVSDADDWANMTAGTDYTANLTAGTITVLKALPSGASSYQVKVNYNITNKVKSSIAYVNALCKKYNYPGSVDLTTAQTYEYLEWIFTHCIELYGLLSDKLAYNPNRVISPGWDDQNFLRLSGDSSYAPNITTPSPIHLALMKAAYEARCATAYIDLPKSLAKQHVSNDSQDVNIRGYAQLLARQDLADSDGLFTTHSALFGPWGTYMYVGTSKQAIASPGFLALLIQRSMILNQSLQYEWIQPSSRKNNVNIGKMDYTVSKKYLDKWQPDPDTEGGVGVNAVSNIPDLGLSIWGDSTLYENPPATYQALRNLSTRLLVNAIKNVVYKVGISITFQYTNQTAFSSFYVGVTPLLDTMKNSGAIDDYKVVIGNDFDALGMVKANSCVGKIYITPNGTVQKITIDMIALPPQTDLTNYS